MKRESFYPTEKGKQGKQGKERNVKVITSLFLGFRIF